MNENETGLTVLGAAFLATGIGYGILMVRLVAERVAAWRRPEEHTQSTEDSSCGQKS